ncbi:MAG: prolyl oligopeptidase family serine peptidase [Solirubrobacteraceae bacterium]|nr:prolyl oligopeptidase family serine peptidase [Solirubrobacteraceae bacterium]
MAPPGQSEQRVFLAAAALIALYVVDDGIVHREPGTSVGDHAVSVLVPLALLGASVLIHRRARPGVGAILALTWGVLALVAGISDGVRHIAVDGLAGDDIAAVLAAAAGAVLVGLGITVLVQSRKREGTLARRVLRRTFLALSAMIVAFFVVMPIAFAIVGTHKAREPAAADLDLGRPHQDVALTTSDGLRLAGSYVPSRNRAAVLVFPGRTGPVDQARLLVRHGYGVLMIDRRGEGEGEGDYSARGWGGVPDVEAALAFLRARPDVDPQRIGGVGQSVGGELLLEAAARDRTLRAVVSEGAGQRSLREQLHAPDAPSGLRWLSPTTMETAANVVLHGQAPPDDLAGLVGGIAPRAVLLIRARDGNADEELNTVYLERAGEPKALWTLERGGHTGALDAEPEVYERRVVGFLRRYLGT